MNASMAREKWSQLLQEVERGARIEITHHNRPVAELVPPPVIAAFAGRLRWLLSEIRAGSSSRVAEILGLPTLGALDPFLDGVSDSTVEFAHQIADRFRVNRIWLKHGEGEPFDRFSWEFWDSDLVDKIEDLRPIGVIFVMEDPKPLPLQNSEYVGTATIVLKWDDLTYQAVNGRVHVSSVNGGGGYGRLKGYCQLCRHFSNARKSGLSPSGCFLEGETLADVMVGRRWAGIVDRAGSRSNWWDDFTDINHDYPIASGYAEWYGPAFIEAQRALRSIFDCE